MDCGERCGMCGYDWHHKVLKANMSNEISRMHASMKEEYERLQQLLGDVSWYNFEVSARGMAAPWNVSNPQSQLRLHGMRFGRKWSQSCGAYVEHGEFPEYYNGTVKDAPALPVDVVLTEMKDAYRQMMCLRIAVDAPYDYAPGGKGYLEVQRSTSLPP